MKHKIIALSLVLTIGGIGAGVGLSVGGPSSISAKRQTVSTQLLAYKVNGQGETYGSAERALAPSQLPDLIQVQATNGVTGYIKKADLLGPAPTLQQVLGYPRDSQGNFVAPPTATSLPVYASNGATQVGDFEVDGSQSSNNPNSENGAAQP
jgi:hypothetical protein